MSFTPGKSLKFIIPLALFLLVLPIFTEAHQTNCTNYDSTILFNYTIELRNATSSGNLISYARCNMTINGGYMNNTPMLSQSNGNYYCPVSTSFNSGYYSTNITCREGTVNGKIYGSFMIEKNTSAFAISSFLVFVSVFFLAYSLFMDREHDILKKFFLLLSIFMFLVILYINGLIIGEEQGKTYAIATQFNTIYTGYIFIFLFVFLYLIIKWIFSIIENVSGSKKEERMD